MRGRYSIIGLDPDLIWRARGSSAEINRNARAPSRTRSRPAPSRRSPRCAPSSPRAASTLPDGLPPMAAGVFGYLGYDMVRLMEELPPPNPDPLGLPDAILMRPTVVIDLRCRARTTLTVVTPVRPAAGVTAERALARAVERLDRGGRRARHAARQGAGRRRRRPRSTCRRPRTRRRPNSTRMVRAGEGIHRGRRHLPGGAGAALRGAVHAAAVRALPRAAPDQPVALPVLSRLRRLRAWSAPARRSWCACATARSRSARSPAPARAARRRTRTRRSRRSCSPIPRSAPST